MLSQAIGELLPSAVGVALSPVPIVAVILMLATPRARVTGTAFAVGWIVGLSVVSVVVLLVAGGADQSDSGASDAVNVFKVVIGLLFFALAAKQWRGRPAPGEDPPLPAWMSTIDTFTAGKSFALGALLSGLNPKNLALTAAAAASIAQADLSGGQDVAAVAVFVVLGSLSVVGPVVYARVAGEKAARRLGLIKQFLVDNTAVIMMVVFAVLGAKILGNGYAGLAG